jgi:Co/Zn/Cd efflux system component
MEEQVELLLEGVLMLITATLGLVLNITSIFYFARYHHQRTFHRYHLNQSCRTGAASKYILKDKVLSRSNTASTRGFSWNCKKQCLNALRKTARYLLYAKSFPIRLN